LIEPLEALGVTHVDHTSPELPTIDNQVFITKLRAQSAESVRALRVQRFWVDFIHSPKAGWNEPYAERHIHETEFALPHFVSFTEIVNSTTKQFTKVEYFLDRLARYHAAMEKMVDSYIAVLPPVKMLPHWATCVLNLDTRPILAKIERLAKGAKDKRPYFAFFMADHHYGVVRPASVPEELGVLSDELWETVCESLSLVNQIHQTSPPPRECMDQLRELAEAFRVQFEPPQDAAGGQIERGSARL
jgi:hypothetical protein